MEEPEAAEPPLHRAARLGDVQEVARLISEGADINARSDTPFYTNLTPLMVAACSTEAETKPVIEWLLAHGADFRATSEREVTAAWYAAGGQTYYDDIVLPDQVERLRLLLDAGLAPEETASNGQSLLHRACRSGDPARVRLLLDRGATGSVSAVSGTRDSIEIPLFAAAESGCAECVQLLLDAGADATEATEYGQLVLPPEINVPDVKLPTTGGETALGIAASSEVAQLLIAAGGDVNSCDWYTDVLGRVLETAEYEAVDNPNAFAIADVLLEAGASLDISLQRPYGTRLYHAAFSHQANVLDYLLQRGASREPNSDGSTPLHGICWQGEYQDEETNAACERIIRTLVEAGFALDARDNEGRTPLHQAADGDWANHTAARVLLELGAEPNPVDRNGRTPLHLAASRKAKECVSVLLASGANPQFKDYEGWTPIDYAEGEVQTWARYAAFDESTDEVDASLVQTYRSLKITALERGVAEAQAILKALQKATSNS